MNSPRPRCRQAYAQFPCELRISTRHECSSFFMTYLHETYFVLMRTKCFHNSIYAIAGEAKYDLHSPIDQSFHHHICRSHRDLLKFNCTFVKLEVHIRMWTSWKTRRLFS